MMLKFIGMFGPKWIPFKIRYWVCFRRLSKIEQTNPFVVFMGKIKRGPIKGKAEWTRKDTW